MFWEIGGVGLRVLGQLGAIEGHLQIGCVHSRLGASVTRAAPPTVEAAGAGGPPPQAGTCWPRVAETREPTAGRNRIVSL